jgi:CRISPR-associated protein Cas1
MHTLAITEQGVHVHAEGELLLVRKEEQVLRRIRLAEVEKLLLFGRVEISSGALALLVRRRARLAGRDSRSAALRLAQLRRALDPDFASGVARALVVGKVAHQRHLLLRGQRRLADQDLAEVLGQLRLLIEQAGRENDLERLRGLEGRAAALYFGQLSKLISVPDLAFNGRSRRPPRDPVNACLSFGYTLLGNLVETEVLRCGLDPALGFFHQPHPGRPALALDLLEEFRPLVDALVLRLVNRRQLGPLDFEHGGPEPEEILAEDPSEIPTTPPETEANLQSAEGIYLAEHGRKVFLAEFFRRLRESLYYPPRDASFELRDIIREQGYHLARVIEGRELVYRAFVPA